MNPHRSRSALLAATLAFAGVALAQTAPPSATPPAPPSAATTPAKAGAAPGADAAAPRSGQAGLRAEPVPARVEAVFKAWDANHDGALTLAEFRSGWQNARRGGAQTGQARLQQQFKQIDANGNGGIDRTEYPNMMLVKRAGSAAPPFSEFDRDNSQKLEFAEYATLVQRLAERRTGTPSPRK